MAVSNGGPGRRIAVLLATYNGDRWLQEQVDSILAQEGVETRIYASDDASTDRTPAILEDYAARGRLRVLPPYPERFRNANRNFLRLIAEAPLDDEAYVAFSDQDDIWLPAKLARAATAIEEGGADAYSSNVVAFWPDGREELPEKAQPQRRYDYLFESSGAGCTFVLPRARFDELRAWVRSHWDESRSLRVHDWLIYAYARIHGWRWFIDRAAGVRYRQHGGNERGVNLGWRAARTRWAEAHSGQFLAEVRAYQRVLGAATPYDRMLRRFNVLDRIRLAFAARHFRRRGRDQLMLATMFMTVRRPKA